MQLKNPTPFISTNNLLVIAALMVTGLLYLYANHNGLGLTHDSFNYLDLAKILAQTGTFSEIHQNKIFPFQTLEIVILSFLGDKAMIGMTIIHGVSIITIVFISIKLAASIIDAVSIRWIYVFTQVFGAPLLLTHSFLWTEPLFILFLNCQFLLLFHFFKTRQLKYIPLVLLFSLLYCWQRKAGMLFSLGLVGFFITYFVSNKKVILVLLVMIMLAIFVLYGGLGSPNYIGEYPTFNTFGKNIIHNLGTVSVWILPLPLNYTLRVIFLLLTLIGITYFYTINYPKMDKGKRDFINCITVTCLFYFISRFFFQRPHYDEAARYLAPIYPSMVLIGFLGIDFTYVKINKNHWQKIVIVVLVCWTIYPITRSVKNVILWHNRDKNPLTLMNSSDSL